MGEGLLLILNIHHYQICRGRLPELHLPSAGPIPSNGHSYKWLGMTLMLTWPLKMLKAFNIFLGRRLMTQIIHMIEIIQMIQMIRMIQIKLMIQMI